MKEFEIGETVRAIALPPYLKTADAMPVLRPSSMIQIGEEGIVLNRNPANYWSVRFSRGAFLIESQYLESLNKILE
jgi:Protein of unknown function (DUF3148)